MRGYQVSSSPLFTCQGGLSCLRIGEMRLITLGGLAALATVVIAGAIWVAWQSQAGPSADAVLSLGKLEQQQENPPYRPDSSRLRFAVAPVLSPQATLENYTALASYLGERLGRPVELVQGRSYAEINALVRSGDVALALVCSGGYTVGRRDFGMEALVVPVVNGEKTYRSYLIVPSGSPVASWNDLRQRSFAFTDPLSNSGRLVPLYVLLQMGEIPERFFKNFIFTYSHDKSIEAVASGLVDAAAVDSLVYDYLVRREPSIAANTRVVWRSPPYGINPLVVHPAMAPALRLQLETILVGMDQDRQGQEVLRILGVDAFVRPDAGAYDLVEAMMEATKVPWGG